MPNTRVRLEGDRRRGFRPGIPGGHRGHHGLSDHADARMDPGGSRKGPLGSTHPDRRRRSAKPFLADASRRATAPPAARCPTYEVPVKELRQQDSDARGS